MVLRKFGNQFIQDPPDPDKPVLVTGPITGTVTLADGTDVDVSEAAIELDSHEVAGEVGHLIGLRHEEEGHPQYTDPEEPFLHLCTELCGEHARPDDDPMQARALARAIPGEAQTSGSRRSNRRSGGDE